MTAIVQFRENLDQPLVDELCKMHEEGRDFRNATAIRCNVHPRRLKNWLLTGAREGRDTLHAQLFLRFSKIEADLRAANIKEVLDTTVCTEKTLFDESGKPVSKELYKRSTHGTQWYMERRWRQFRNDWTPNEDDTEVSQMLTEQATGSGINNMDAAMAIVAQLAAAMPPQLAAVFGQSGWRQLSPSEAAHLDSLRKIEGTATDERDDA